MLAQAKSKPEGASHWDWLTDLDIGSLRDESIKLGAHSVSAECIFYP